MRGSGARGERLLLLTRAHTDLKLPSSHVEQDGLSEGGMHPVSAPNKETWSFKLDSTMDSVGMVEAAAEKMAADAGLDEDQVFHLTMAVREATVNAVLHGNEYDRGRKIEGSLENTGNDLVF